MYIAISGDVFNSGALTPKSTLEFTHLHTIVIHVVTSKQPVSRCISIQVDENASPTGLTHQQMQYLSSLALVAQLFYPRRYLFLR